MKLTRFQRPDLMNWPGLDDQISTLRDEINQLFEDPFGRFGRAADLFANWTPAVDVYEDKDNVIVQAEVPGMRKEDLDVSIHNDTLILSGERKVDEDTSNGNSRRERFYGRFQRSVTLPKVVQADKVKGTYKDGILTVTLPKAEEAKPRQIEVQVS